MPRNSEARDNSVLTEQDVSDGLHILRSIIERMSQEAGYEVPVENGHFMMTKPARDMLNKLVTPCGECTKSKDHEDAQLIHSIPLNSTIGLIL